MKKIDWYSFWAGWTSLWALVMVIILLFILMALTSCHHIPTDPPNGPPDMHLPEVAMILPLEADGEKLPLGWLNFGDVDADGDQDIIYSHWHDVDSIKPGHQKMVAVWLNNGPGEVPTLAWSDIWTEPQEYFSYPPCPDEGGFCCDWEQGPLVVANMKGGDGGRCEIAYRRFVEGKYKVFLSEGATGQCLKKCSVAPPGNKHKGVQDILAGNLQSSGKNSRDTVVFGYRHNAKTVHLIEGRDSRTLALRWRYELEHEGRYNEKWAAHRIEIIPWPNGKDVIWYGSGILDWNGKGRLSGGPEYQNSQIELLGINRDENFYDRHWDSLCYLDSEGQGNASPILYATTDSKRAWRFPALSIFQKPSGQAYWEYVADKKVGINGDEWDRTTNHTHRFRVLRDGADPRFLCTDVYSVGGYRAIVFDGNFKIKARIPTHEEGRDIEWDGFHDKKEVLVDGLKGGVYDIDGKLMYSRMGKAWLESNFVCDLWGKGHQQFFDARRTPDGIWQLVAYANSKAYDAPAVPIDVNNHFY